MLSVSLGPVALPIKPVLLLIGMFASSAFARILAKQAQVDQTAHDFSGAITRATLLGLVVARFAYIVDHLDPYLAQPWSMLDMRDGGYTDWVGGLAAGAWLLFSARTSRKLQVIWGSVYVTTWIAALAALWTLAQSAPRDWIEPLDARTRSQSAELYPVLIEAESGRLVTLRHLSNGRPLVINLWASWCAPCRAEMPDLAQAQVQNPGIAFVFANQGEAQEVVQTFMEKQPYRVQNVVLDKRRALAIKAQSAGLPTTLFIDATGNLRDAHFGVLNTAALQARLADLHR